jgi:hypothetical protein
VIAWWNTKGALEVEETDTNLSSALSKAEAVAGRSGFIGTPLLVLQTIRVVTARSRIEFQTDEVAP